jgi:hypothetical protein
MVGVGAVIGSLAAGITNAARSPEAGPAEVADSLPATPPLAKASLLPTAARPSSAAQNSTATQTETTPAPQVPQISPAQAIAMRFPPRWQAPPSSRDDSAPRALAYAPEPAHEPAPSSSYRLASVDPAPDAVPALPPKRAAAKPVPRNTALFNDAQLASIKQRLKLTPQQEQYWPQVEQALRAISFKLARQQNSKRPVRGKQLAMIDPNSPEVARLKSAAIPLIMSMREDQKQEVRQLAHTMGLAKVAAMF